MHLNNSESYRPSTIGALIAAFQRQKLDVRLHAWALTYGDGHTMTDEDKLSNL